jgi:hypothetical protein
MTCSCIRIQLAVSKGDTLIMRLVFSPTSPLLLSSEPFRCKSASCILDFLLLLLIQSTFMCALCQALLQLFILLFRFLEGTVQLFHLSLYQKALSG